MIIKYEIQLKGGSDNSRPEKATIIDHGHGNLYLVLTNPERIIMFNRSDLEVILENSKRNKK